MSSPIEKNPCPPAALASDSPRVGISMKKTSGAYYPILLAALSMYVSNIYADYLAVSPLVVANSPKTVYHNDRVLDLICGSLKGYY